ncbi:MAG: AMP-binding protein, partial [Eubacteriales bacterium]|nr:AMP-binding protein [Eubacteriales bacterium]
KMAAVGVAAFSESSQAKGWNHEEVKHPSDPDYEAIAILYSSGTTSNAKGVVIGYEQEMRAMDRLLEVVGTSDIRYLMMFPNSHVSGFTDALVLLLRGGTLATMEESSATQLVKGFQIYKPNTFGMVPKVWETFKGKIEEGIRAKGKTKARVIFGLISLCGKLRKATGINMGRKVFASINQEVFGGNLQNIHTGGGKAIPEVNEFFWNLGFDVYDFYASTEANIPIMVAKSVRKPLAGMGKPTALKGIDLRIQNPDTTGVGEIQVKSDTLMRGYFRNPELTLAAYEDGYFKTGDYGKLENGEIFITGRIKDSIYLKNGEKVSPDDIETMYRKYLPEEIDFSVAGVADDQGYSHVGVFVVGEKGQYDHLFRKINKQMSENYRFKELTYVESLPKTSVGKVKRYLLVKETGSKDGENIRLGEKDSISKNRENIRKSDLEAILRKYIGDGDWDKDALLRENLGISSLELLQIVNEIMDVFGVDLTEHLGEIFTCKDLEEILYRQEASRPKEENVSSQKPLDLQAFPVKRTFMKNACFRFVMFFLKRNYRFSVVGLENLKKNQNYIICPNHQSHVDGYAVWAAMGKKRPKFNAIACFAKKEHLDNRFSRFFMEVVGGIPLDRYKNPVPAMKRAEEWMKDCQHFLLIHPEGTRTRDGKLGTFLDGAAYLSQKTQCPIIPVKIEGLYEIWPADRKRPRLRKKNFQKYEIVIRFGKPIDPRESTKEEITGRIREDIEGGTDFVENSFGKNEKSSGKDTFSLEILQEMLLSQTSSNMNTGDGVIENLTMNDRLAEDLGMGSLAFFEIVSELESRYHLELSYELDEIKTVGDFFRLLKISWMQM